MPIANNDPYFGALPPPDQDPQAIMRNQQAGGARPQGGPLDDILLRMITQNLGQAPPPERPLNNWEVFAGLMHPELMNVLMARKQDTPQWQQYQATQKVMPSLLQAYGSEQSRLGTNERFQQTQDRLGNQFNQHMNWQKRMVPVVKQGVDANGAPTLYNLMYDPVSKQYFRPDTGEPVDITQMSQPIPYQNYAGPQGENVSAPTKTPPATPLTPQPIQRPSNTGIGHAPSTPSMGGVQGGQAQNMAPAGAAGQPTRRGTHMAPPGPAGQAAERTAFAIGLDPLIGYQQKAHAAQVGTFGNAQLSADPTTGFGLAPLAGQNAADFMARSPKLQPLMQTGGGMQDVLNYNTNLGPSLYAYTKSQTGAQFSYQEFERYRSSFPTSMDDEYTATEKIGSLLRIARADVIAKQEQFHGIEVDPRFAKYAGRVMPRDRYQRLTAEDRIAFVAGGGTVNQ